MRRIIVVLLSLILASCASPAEAAGKQDVWYQMTGASSVTTCVGDCEGWSYSPYWMGQYNAQVGTTTIAILKVTPQVYFPCSGCAPTMVRGFATAGRYNGATKIMLGQDVPAQPSLWLTYERAIGGVAATQSTHVYTTVYCCVAAWTNPRFITESGSGALGATGFNARAWATVWYGGNVYEFNATAQQATAKIYVDEGAAIGAGTCVGWGCGD